MADLQQAENVSGVNSDGGPVKVAAAPEPPKTETEHHTAAEPENPSPKKRRATDKDDGATAKKKRSPPKAAKTTAEAEDGGEEVVPPQTPRKRKASGTPMTPGRSIPATIDEADEADRTLVKMKDEGCTWPDIRAAWMKITGETSVGASTLPLRAREAADSLLSLGASNRYNRLKANFVQFTEEDGERLQAAKIEVEAKFNTEKWAKIAEGMEAMGSRKFSTAIIQKKVKELEKNGED